MTIEQEKKIIEYVTSLLEKYNKANENEKLCLEGETADINTLNILGYGISVLESGEKNACNQTSCKEHL